MEELEENEGDNYKLMDACMDILTHSKLYSYNVTRRMEYTDRETNRRENGYTQTEIERETHTD